MEELFLVLIAVKDAASLGSPPHDVAQALDCLKPGRSTSRNRQDARGGGMVGQSKHEPGTPGSLGMILDHSTP